MRGLGAEGREGEVSGVGKTWTREGVEGIGRILKGRGLKGEVKGQIDCK